MTKKCSYVALLGAPNAGKSTLLNTLTGHKLSIVSAKPQTTRRRILGIVTKDDTQLVFVDLPGVFAPRRRMDRAMVATAWESAREADLIMVLVDAAHEGSSTHTKRILKWLTEEKKQAVLVLNKIDALPKAKLLPKAKELFETGLFTDVLMISALKDDGCDAVMKLASERAPAGPWQYEEDELTDLPEREWAAEITREQTYMQLSKELPYAIAVETESWKRMGKKGVRVEQTLYVSRPTQRAIVLGDKGSRIKEIGTAARLEMERELETPIHLFLQVKVKEEWMDDPAFLARHGLQGD